MVALIEGSLQAGFIMTRQDFLQYKIYLIITGYSTYKALSTHKVTPSIKLLHVQSPVFTQSHILH